DRVKGNNAPAAKAEWRRFMNNTLPNGDEVGVVAAWAFPGQGASPPSAEMAEAERNAEYVFLQLLGRYTPEGRIVSDKPNGANFAPKRFAEEQEAKLARITQAALAAAMRRLFAAKRVRVLQEGRAHHRKSRVVLAEQH